ncbi:MAG: cation diffusion facilitator family transporter [Phycisphaerales bacterium]|nr:cation diffusion facilitator family transporter [Phycisphaerales bacterium]
MTDSHELSAKRSRAITLVGLGVNVALALVKLLSGILGHSGALVADAIESLADIAGSLVIWSGLAIGSRPADDDHPYGHGKAEALAGLVVAIMVVAAGVGIAVKAVHDIRTPHTSPALFTLAVLVAVVVIKTGMFIAARRVAKAEGSGAVEVDAFHHVSDAITSLAAFLGITVALFGSRWFATVGWRWETADDWAALVAAGVILYNGLSLGRIPLRELMDATHPDDVQRAIEPARRVAMEIEHVRAIEKVRARKSGSGFWLDMHVQVDPDMPVRAAHAVGGRVRAAVRTKVPGVRDVLVHIEPYGPSASEP